MRPASGLDTATLSGRPLFGNLDAVNLVDPRQVDRQVATLLVDVAAAMP